jgi:Fur family ferric uptake transcriptional regulator
MSEQQRTRAQRAVLAALGGERGFVSAQELHARLRAGGDGVGLTSVYRALQVLADEGSVDTVRSAGGEVAYRSCLSPSHHHHLVCVTCGRAVEVEAPTLETWVEQTARAHGYTVAGHTLEVTGTCPDCR